MWLLWASLALAGLTNSELVTLREALDQAYGSGDHELAAELAAELAEATEQAFPGHLYGLQNRMNLGFMLGEAGRHAEAEAQYRQLLVEVDTRDDVPLEVRVGVLTGLAAVLSTQGSYPESARILQAAMQLVEPLATEQPEQVAWVADALCTAEEDLGRFEQALSHCERALSLARQVLDPDDPSMTTFLSNTGMMHVQLGNYERARNLYEESIARARRVRGDRHPDVALGLNNLAALLHRLGQDEQAAAYYREALDINQEAWPDGHPRIADVLDSLGSISLPERSYDRSRALMEQALEMRTELYGPHHWIVALSMSNLAILIGEAGDLRGSVELLEQALKITVHHVGEAHPFVATLHHNLATPYHRLGDLDQALLHAEHALTLHQQQLGTAHPALAESHQTYGVMLATAGRRTEAREHLQAALSIATERRSLLDAMSEREAMDYLPELRIVLDTWLGIFNEPADTEQAFHHLRDYKGALVARTRARRDRLGLHPMLAADLDRALELARQRARLALSGEPALREQAETLRIEQERLERGIAGVKTDLTPAPMQALCAALPEDTALIDIARARGRQDFYVAFVLEPDCKLQRVMLGEAGSLDAHITAWRTLVSRPDALMDRLTGRGEPITAQLVAPLRAATDASRWVVVPDGGLATLPLGALPTDQGLLIEELAITYLDRADDLLRPGEVSASGTLLVGGVDYGVPVEEPACGLAPFAPLAGTQDEVHQVHRAVQRSSRRREPSQRLTSSDATEAAVSTALGSHAIAHVATHGYALAAECGTTEPMMRSGLALAGANAALAGGRDGLLSATELAMLDLSRSELLVLSACGTGLGPLRAGRILGLRRAAAIAGVPTLVMSLWSVPDGPTAALMRRFYHHLLHRRRPLSPADALRQAQLEVLAAQRDQGWVRPSQWAAFVVAGRP